MICSCQEGQMLVHTAKLVAQTWTAHFSQKCALQSTSIIYICLMIIMLSLFVVQSVWSVWPLMVIVVLDGSHAQHGHDGLYCPY